MSLCQVAGDWLSYSVLSPSIGSLLGFVVIICLGRCYFSLFQFDHYIPEAQPQSITICKQTNPCLSFLFLEKECTFV